MTESAMIERETERHGRKLLKDLRRAASGRLSGKASEALILAGYLYTVGQVLTPEGIQTIAALESRYGR